MTRRRAVLLGVALLLLLAAGVVYWRATPTRRDVPLVRGVASPAVLAAHCDDAIGPARVEQITDRVFLAIGFDLANTILIRTDAGNVIVDFLGKLLPVVVVVVGATDVFNNTLSVGALIAFQMITMKVTQPLIAVVGLINEYQETAISVKMLGEVMNRAPEGRSGSAGLRPTLQGNITFDNVTFRYPGAANLALDRASFTIQDLFKTDISKGPGIFTVPGLMKIKVFRKPATKARKGVNPFTGEEMMFKAKPARNVVKVLALKNLKAMV